MLTFSVCLFLVETLEQKWSALTAPALKLLLAFNDAAVTSMRYVIVHDVRLVKTPSAMYAVFGP